MKKSRKQGTVQVQISRVSGSREYIEIRIEDEASHVVMVEAQLTFEEFAKCITSMPALGVPAEFGALNLIGKKYESKTEVVPGLGYDNWKDRGKLIKPYEIDGWIADEEERINSHKCSQVGYTIIFRRWV